MLLIRKMQPFSLQPNEATNDENSFTKIFRNFHVNWPISIGMLMGIQLEFSSGDWATIYTKEDLHFNAGLATIPYICFMFAMIAGRLTIHRFSGHNPIEKLVRIGGISGGGAFIVGLTLSHFLAKTHPWLAFLAICVGFLIGGFGSSFLGPMFLNAANRASDSPGGVVVGQLGVVNNILTFVVKAIIAWTAQWLSLSVALLIPGAMLIGVSLFAKVIAEEPRQRSNSR
jgi:sugar phosphate permease